MLLTQSCLLGDTNDPKVSLISRTRFKWIRLPRSGLAIKPSEESSATHAASRSEGEWMKNGEGYDPYGFFSHEDQHARRGRRPGRAPSANSL